MGESCIHCQHPVGLSEGVIPFHATDEDGTSETWCPQCFVWHRAPMEPERFPERVANTHTGFRAIRCTSPKCGLESVDPGIGRCLHCGCSSLTVLRAREESK